MVFEVFFRVFEVFFGGDSRVCVPRSGPPAMLIFPSMGAGARKNFALGGMRQRNYPGCGNSRCLQKEIQRLLNSRRTSPGQELQARSKMSDPEASGGGGGDGVGRLP